MHLTRGTAFDLMEGRLEKALEQHWMEHLDVCSDCLAELRECQEFFTVLQRQHLYDAPAPMLEAARTLFKAPPPATPVSQVRQVIATLFFDSLNEPAFAGLRGEASARQMVLRTEEFDIHVRMWAANEKRQLLGQIQPRGTSEFIESARLHLLQDGERVSTAEANDLGEFHFSFSPGGFLSLQVDLPHLTVIGALDVVDRN